MNKFVLVPRKTGESKDRPGRSYFDMTEIKDDSGFPCALVITDTFNDEIRDRLATGQTVVVTMEIAE